jgi:lysophospholipase L1-like esterase
VGAIRFLLLGVVLLLAATGVSAQVPRVLYVGDSWTYYPWAMQDPPALRTVLAKPEIGLGTYIEDGTIALIQPTAVGWDAPDPLGQIQQKLIDNPTIDIVHLSLGGNDVNLGLGGNFSPDHVASMNGTAVGHIQNIVNFILAQRPDMRVAICGYDYLNITEGVRYNQFLLVESMETPTATAYLVYGLPAPFTVQDVLNNQNNLNDVVIDLESRKLNLAQATNRTRYIHNFGLMQAVYGIPSLNVPPTAPANVPVGWTGNFSNFPAGNRDLFSPRQAMDGASDLDPIHLADAAYLRLMENAVTQVYYAWLKDSEAPAVSSIEVSSNKEDPTGTIDFEVTFSEDVTGVDATDFEVVATGLDSASVESVSGSGADYVVRVAYTGALGTVRLDLVDDDTIYDGVWNPLGKKNLVHTANDGDFRNGALAVVGGEPEGEDPIEGEPVCTAPARTPRVLIVGDSWAAGVYLSGALDEVLDEYGLTHVGVEGLDTAIGGSKAEQWVTTQWRGKITQALLDFPTIDTIHLIIGGNDILGHIKDTDVYESPGSILREAWWDAIEDDVQTVVDHCLLLPQVRKVVLADYDYLNRVTAQLFYSLTGASNDFGGMTQFEVNKAFIEVGQRKLAVALRTPGCEYIHNFGMLQYTYDIPTWAVRPGGPPNYLPYPGGDNALPMPDSAFDPLDLFGTIIPGDGIHPSAAAHKVLLRNAVEQTYLALYANELICPEGEGVEEGVLEGTPEGTIEGITEGTTEGIAEGGVEGSVEGTIEGVAEGTLEGAIEGSPEGNIEGTPEGVVEGVVEGSTEGTIEGVVEGVVEGSTEGTIEGVVEGSLEGTPEGSVEGTPEGTVEGSVEGIAEGSNEGSPEGEGINEGEGTADGEGTPEGEGASAPGHAADYDGDGKINLSEILRLIQFYNFANGFGCGNGEDGFALGAEDKNCPFHSSDYTEPRWIITLSELLRSVQLFNMNGYWPCPEASEDGFCAGDKPGK